MGLRAQGREPSFQVESWRREAGGGDRLHSPSTDVSTEKLLQPQAILEGDSIYTLIKSALCLDSSP